MKETAYRYAYRYATGALDSDAAHGHVRRPTCGDVDNAHLHEASVAARCPHNPTGPTTTATLLTNDPPTSERRPATPVTFSDEGIVSQIASPVTFSFA